MARFATGEGEGGWQLLLLGAGDRARCGSKELQASMGRGLQVGRGMCPPYDIQERTFQFSVQVVQFCRDLWKANPATRRIGWQLLDSATSIGANMEEADAAQSRRDFISKTGIARKESRESVYWLRLIIATDLEQRPRVLPLLDEAKQIARIITTIKKNAEAGGS